MQLCTVYLYTGQASDSRELGVVCLVDTLLVQERVKMNYCSISYIYTLSNMHTHIKWFGHCYSHLHHLLTSASPALHPIAQPPPEDMGWVELRGTQGVGSVYSSRCPGSAHAVLRVVELRACCVCGRLHQHDTARHSYNTDANTQPQLHGKYIVRPDDVIMM